MEATDRLIRTRRAPGSLPAQRAITIDGILLVLFVGGLAWVPYWFGSNRTMPWGINAILFAGLAALYELALIIRGMPHPVAVRSIRLSAVLFAVATAWAFVQNATWTPAEWHHPIWQLASDVLGRPIAGSISVDRDLTAIALLRLMTAASVFWLALQLGRDAGRARFLLWSVVGIGAAYAAIGFFAFGFMPDHVVFPEIAPEGGSSHFVSSTFVNKNSYATFAGIGFIAVAALIQRLYRREVHGDLLQQKIAALLNATTEKGILPLAMAFLIMVCLLLTGSRGGIISTAFGLIALVVLNIRRFGRNEAVLGALVIAVAGVVILAFGDVFFQSIGSRGLFDETRLARDAITVQSILSAPLLGYGYGTFEAVFPMFRDNSMSVWLFQERAHDTYLEVLQGLGLLFGTMLIASVLLLVYSCVKGARIGERDTTIPLVAVSVSVLVGVHALVDFSLQIQAVTLTYMAVLGIGVAQSVTTEVVRRRNVS